MQVEIFELVLIYHAINLFIAYYDRPNHSFMLYAAVSSQNRTTFGEFL